MPPSHPTPRGRAIDAGLAVALALGLGPPLLAATRGWFHTDDFQYVRWVLEHRTEPWVALTQLTPVFQHIRPGVLLGWWAALVASDGAAWGPRVLLVALGLGALAGIMTLATRLHGRRAGLVAGLLALAAPWAALWSWSSWMGSAGEACFGVWSLVAADAALRGGRARAWTAAGIGVLAAGLFKESGWIVYPVAIAVLALTRPGAARGRVPGVAAVGLLGAAGLVITHHPGNTARALTGGSLTNVFSSLADRGGDLLHAWPVLRPADGVLAPGSGLAGLAVVLWGVAWAVQRGRGPRPAGLAVGAALALASLAIIVWLPTSVSVHVFTAGLGLALALAAVVAPLLAAPRRLVRALALAGLVLHGAAVLVRAPQGVLGEENRTQVAGLGALVASLGIEEVSGWTAVPGRTAVPDEVYLVTPLVGVPFTPERSRDWATELLLDDAVQLSGDETVRDRLEALDVLADDPSTPHQAAELAAGRYAFGLLRAPNAAALRPGGVLTVQGPCVDRQVVRASPRARSIDGVLGTFELAAGCTTVTLMRPPDMVDTAFVVPLTDASLHLPAQAVAERLGDLPPNTLGPAGGGPTGPGPR